MRTKKRRKLSPERKAAKEALRVWREEALERSGHKCEWCGATKYLNVHHIIGKKYKPLRTHPFNSIVLCARCHKFGVGTAAHENPIRVVKYLKMARPLVLDFLEIETNKLIDSIY